MTTDLSQKRREVELQHATLRAHLAQGREQLVGTAKSPKTIAVVAVSGVVLYTLWQRRPAPRRTTRTTEEESVSPTSKRVTILLGSLLGTAIRRSVLDLVSDFVRSSEHESSPDTDTPV